jgi:hypothetical protein
VEGILTEADEKAKDGIRRRGKKEGLEGLGKRVCKINVVSLTKLRSGSRRHAVVDARREFSRVGDDGSP